MALGRHLGAEHRRAPAAGREKPEQHRQRRRLAGAVAAQKRRRRAAPHGERDPVHCDDAAVRFRKVGDDDRGIVRRRQHWIVCLQYCSSSRTTAVPPTGFCALAWPCSIASLNSYFLKNASNCSAPTVPSAESSSVAAS